MANDIIIENAHLILKNFSGKPSKFNAEGNRNFGVLLDTDIANSLADDGWNVKHYIADVGKDNEHDQAWLKVKVRFGRIPPKIYKISGGVKRELTEDNISQLDWQRFDNVDLTIHPYDWEVSGRTGITAYLSVGYFTIQEDEFASKYADIPDAE